ncbi:MAG: pyruvate formate lyase family protein [Armatimonadota bacterium]
MMSQQALQPGATALALTPRIERLRARSWAGEFGPHSQQRAEIALRVFAECQTPGCPIYTEFRVPPRVLQIAQVLEAVLAAVPAFVAEDELLVGRRLAFGYPEHDEAINQGAAEPGYMIAGYDVALSRGLTAIIQVAETHLAALDAADPAQMPRTHFLRAAILSLRAAIRYAERHAEEAERQAAGDVSPARRAELLEIARICRKVPAQPATTFYEALQSLWLTHLAIYFECENVAFSFGRIDQYLWPYLEADLAAGRLDMDGARELLANFWVKVYDNVFGNIGHVQTVTIGGRRPDGEDGTNPLTYLCIEVTRLLSNVGPSVAFRRWAGSPPEYRRDILALMRDGRYMPQIYNDDVLCAAYEALGVPPEDANQYGIIGCHEPSLCGLGYHRPASWPGYVCCPDWVEWALNRGRFVLSGEQRGFDTGDPADFATFDDLLNAVKQQLAYNIRQEVLNANQGEVVKRQLVPRPFLSSLLADCLERGMDFTEGGTRYNFSGFQAFSIGTTVDALAAIRQVVYEEQRLTLPELIDILQKNFDGHEELRQYLRTQCPKYGRDDERVDALAVDLITRYADEVARYTNARGGPFIPALWGFWAHVGNGKLLGASADGRLAREALSHSTDPVPGMAQDGPTAVIRSATKLPWHRMANGGTLLLEFQSQLLYTEDGLSGIDALNEGYFALGGIQLQLSAVTLEQLLAAQQAPERFQHLVVRVAGYCDYFVRQSAEQQEYIIQREKHVLG